MSRTQRRQGIDITPSTYLVDPAEARKRVFSNVGWVSRLCFLGSLFSFRTLTSEQAAALTGDHTLAAPTRYSAAGLFNMGLLDVGTTDLRFPTGSRRSSHTIYRPARGSVFDDSFKSDLTWPEWISITGGLDWQARTNYDRHDILSTELALRIAEYTDVSTVLGERFSTVDLLAGSGIGRPPRVGDQRAADLTAVRSDGLRIAVELTASTSSSANFRKKVATWARLLSDTPFDRSGLTVVFVLAPHPFAQASNEMAWLRQLRADTYQAIAAAVRQYPGVSFDRVAERMGVATWREWFPDTGKVHDSFFTLRVDRPTGHGKTLWEPCDLLDPTEDFTPAGVLGLPFHPRHPDQMLSVITNSALLGQTPFWIRERLTPPELWRLIVKNNPAPHPAPLRPERARGLALGAPNGAVGATRPPLRLLGINR